MHNLPYKRIPNCRGVTLIELLVAFVLMTMIIAIASLSLRTSSVVFQAIEAPYAEEFQRMARLRESLAAIQWVVVERINPYDNSRTGEVFFDMTPHTLTYVSARPLTLSVPARSHLFLDGEKLVLQESPFFAPTRNYLATPGQEPPTASVNRVVLLSGVEAIRISAPLGTPDVELRPLEDGAWREPLYRFAIHLHYRVDGEWAEMFVLALAAPNLRALTYVQVLGMEDMEETFP